MDSGKRPSNFSVTLLTSRQPSATNLFSRSSVYCEETITVWSFLMSCCIGGAVCLLFFIAVASGIAFGYHYSISEFLKYNDSLLSINLRRDINGPLDAETWWPEDPKSFFRRNGRKQFYGPTTEEDFGVVGVEAITTTESTTTIEAIVPKNLIFAITAKNVPLNDVLKQYVPGSVNQMKTAMDHIYYVNKARKPSRTTRRRTSVSYRRLSSKRKTVKPFEYISDYEDMLMTARTFTPIALFSEYDENEIENWRRVAQSMVYDYPEVHDTETKPKEEAYPIYDRGAIRKEYTGRRKKIKTAYYFIDPSYPATREVTSINHIDNTNTKSTKRLKYIFTNTKMSQGTESKEDVIEKDERDNKTHEYLGKVLAGYAR